MSIREATIDDIKQIQIVRNSVRENTLSDPNLVTDEDCEEYLIKRGKGWVCVMYNMVVGFAIIDLKDNNVWALFLDPRFEKQGIGRQLLDTMMDWYFKVTTKTAWLGTSPKTRAESFYRKAGWTEVGTHGKGEIKFEMSYSSWTQLRSTNTPSQ